ncbi:CRR6 family NdhI maturation factor [Leptolyngbya sp. AN02str]|uniref:CRR6 family NdhI maturation factor n=1 Tax=Leptolyngbya sp. AN02str TaxID=3423363 RepID=UPI003D31938B
MTIINLTAEHIHQLDLSPAVSAIAAWQSAYSQSTQVEHATDGGDPLAFTIEFPLEASDPRELSEVPEVRLWFVRLDAHYPWLPLALDWEAGELARYAAMLLPHQFSPTDGIQFNPEALELFVMGKVFTVMEWMKQQQTMSRTKIKFMTQVLGYELDDAFFDFIERA